MTQKGIWQIEARRWSPFGLHLGIPLNISESLSILSCRSYILNILLVFNVLLIFYGRTERLFILLNYKFEELTPFFYWNNFETNGAKQPFTYSFCFSLTVVNIIENR